MTVTRPSAPPAAPTLPAWAGRRRPRCGCCRTTSTPRSPSTPRSSSSTAAPARPRATGRRFDAIVRTLHDARRTTRRCSCSPASRSASCTRTSGRRACCIANSNLVGDWANWDEFRRLEALGLTMYGQMTAGSWIYIGTQGILQGTYETFAAVAAKRFGGILAGTITLTARPRRHGRRAAARGHHERRRRDLHRGRPVAHRTAGSSTGYLDVEARRPRPCAASWPSRPATPGARCRSACSATAPTSSRELLRRAPRSTSSPTRRARTTRSPTCRAASRSRTGRRARQGPRRASPTAPASRWPARRGHGRLPGRGRRGLRLRQLAPRRGPARRLRARVRLPRVRPGLHPPAVLRGPRPVSNT